MAVLALGCRIGAHQRDTGNFNYGVFHFKTASVSVKMKVYTHDMASDGAKMVTDRWEMKLDELEMASACIKMESDAPVIASDALQVESVALEMESAKVYLALGVLKMESDGLEFESVGTDTASDEMKLVWFSLVCEQKKE